MRSANEAEILEEGQWRHQNNVTTQQTPACRAASCPVYSLLSRWGVAPPGSRARGSPGPRLLRPLEPAGSWSIENAHSSAGPCVGSPARHGGRPAPVAVTPAAAVKGARSRALAAPQDNDR
jgi:hypothetical protein